MTGPFTLKVPELHVGMGDPGPFVEVLLYPSRDGTTVLFRAAHVVTDGRGLQFWDMDVFRSLRGLAPAGAPSRLNHDEFVAQVCAPQEQPAASGEIPELRYPSLLGPPASTEAPLRWWRRAIDGTYFAATAKVRHPKI